MAAKKPAPAAVAPGYTVQNCTFTAEAGKTSPEVANAVKALADASARHADALSSIAKALSGVPGVMQTGIRIGGCDE